MYLNFYGLKKEPFNITPDPQLFFLSPSHKEALAGVMYGVKQRKGFIAVIGEVGVGKTTVIRSYLETIDKRTTKAIYLFNSNVSFRSLLGTIYKGLGCTAESDDVAEMVDHLHRILIDAYRAGVNVVLVIDEAQNMPVETLENLRMLSNLETATNKLIQIVFSGQPEFEEKLNLQALRQLKQRIAIKVRILPLTHEESLGYISHRLSKTVMENPSLFTRGALGLIVRKAGGIPRTINILCDNCLITAFGNQQKNVSLKVAREIIADLAWEKRRRARWGIAFLVPPLVVLAAFWFYANYLPVSVGAGAGNQSPAAEKVAIERTAVPSAAVTVQAVPATNGVPSEDHGSIASKPPTKVTSVSRIVKRGDTLAKLIGQTYGAVDKETLLKVKRSNPGITNENVIVEGDRIYFPIENQ